MEKFNSKIVSLPNLGLKKKWNFVLGVEKIFFPRQQPSFVNHQIWPLSLSWCFFSLFFWEFVEFAILVLGWVGDLFPALQSPLVSQLHPPVFALNYGLYL